MKNIIYLKNYNYILKKIIVIIPAILFWLLFIWFRVIRERLPQEIPFHLSILTCLVLILICIMYVFSLYILIRPPKIQVISLGLISIIKFVFYPLNELNLLLLQNKYSRNIIISVIRIIIYINDKVYINCFKKLYKYMLYFIVPKIIFVICLIMDCFILGKLYSIYSCGLLLFIILLYRYMLLFMRYLIEDIIILLEKENFFIEITSTDEEYNSEETELSFYAAPSSLEYDSYFEDLGPYLNTDRYQYLKIRKFIEYQSNGIYFDNLPYKYKILYQEERQDVILLSPFKKLITNRTSKTSFKERLDLAIKLEVFIREIEFGSTYNIVKTINIIVNIISLICWSYILVVTIYYSSINEKLTIIEYLFNFLEYLNKEMAEIFINPLNININDE